MVERGFIEALGLDPEDDDWYAVGRDLVKPLARDARARIYAKRLRSFPEEGAPR